MSAAHAGPATGDRRPLKELILLLAAAVGLQAIVWAVMLQVFSAGIGYHLHDLADTPHYLSIAERVTTGSWPYADFPFEYPPLSLLAFLAPGTGSLAGYERWFAAEMIVVCAAAAVATTAVAARLWPGVGRPLGAAAAFAAAVAAAGAISINRFDPTVGVVVILCVLALVYRRWTLAAVAAGLGFSLKLVPIVLLPLVLILAATRRATLRACLAAAVAAFIPFLPFLIHDPGALRRDLLGYQGTRGLQIESVAATPYLVEEVLRSGSVTVVVPPGGSLTIDAPGTVLLAGLAPLVVLVLLLVVYMGVWRARSVFRRDLSWVPPAALAVLLAAICGNKVLSPQHLLWLLPLVALCLAAEQPLQRAVGVLVLIATALTQVEFPALYHETQMLDTLPLLVIAARNALLVGALALAVVALWRSRPRTRVGNASPAVSRQAM